jgi:nicotinamidase-related amidase
MERLDPGSTVIFVVDVQEKLAAAMPDDALEKLVKNTAILLETAKTLGMTVLASEQYPKGLGPTLPAIPIPNAPFPKLTFDAISDLAISRALAATHARAVVVAGMETHVCVFQTARSLVKRGYATYVVADAVASRTKKNRALGLSLCERAGAIVSPTETIVFDLLERAGTDAFKTLSKLVK